MTVVKLPQQQDSGQLPGV